MTREVGLDQLYAPGEGKPIIADIVFVHGMNGDRHTSWTKSLRKGQVVKHDRAAPGPASDNLSRLEKLASRLRLDRKEVGSRSIQPHNIPRPGSEASSVHVGQPSTVFWPQDLLPKDFACCRIYTWGYNVDIRYLRGSRSTATILDHSRTLVSDLAQVRRLKEDQDRPLIFVAHSLGGVVVKKALNISNEESGPFKVICNATCGICFLGTPHRGSSKAAMIDGLGRVSWLWGNVPNTKITQVLIPEAEILRDVHDSFIKNPIIPKVKIYTFHEGLDSQGVTIVDRFSSTVGLPGEVQSDIPADHVNMAKFASPTDQGYLRIRGASRQLVDDIQSSSSQEVLSLAEMTTDCLNSLRSAERSSRAHQVTDSYKDTYSWLFSDAVTFSDWLKEPNCAQAPIFYIVGRAGSGKSTIMKFALTDHRTQELLQSSHKSPWSLIPFFFYDRGSDVQKTISGLLQEILYQLLDKYRELVPLIYHIRLNRLRDWISDLRILEGVELGGNFDSEWHHTNATRAQQSMKAVEEERSRQEEIRQFFSEVLWQSSEVDEALNVIVRQSKVPLYCLLFIDALDEHNGDHNKLLEALKRFTNRDGTGAAHIKLCLASRPEPLFMKVLGGSPGFAIQHYTEADIKAYTFGRLETVFTDQDRLYDSSMLKRLAGEVTQKANGVFIWVKIVVDNLVEAVIDGSSMTQLNLVLSSLPDDLAQLYRRIICKRKPAYLKEVYVMFQLVLHSEKHPLSLEALMAATDVALYEHWDPAPDDVMQRRLVSRCGGLLDLVLENKHEVVQLVHQTLKEYLHVSDNATLGLSFPGQNPQTDGMEYLLKYSVYIAAQMNMTAIEKHSKPLNRVFQIACKLEYAGIDVTINIDGLLQSSVAVISGRQVDGLRVWSNSVRPDSVENPLRAGHRGSDRDYDLMLIAAENGCISYVMHKVVGGLPVMLLDRCPLIFCHLSGFWSRITSFTRQGRVSEARVDDTIELLDLLLAKGSDVNCEWKNETPLSLVINRAMFVSDMKPMIPIVQWLLKHGADPNRKFLHIAGGSSDGHVELTKILLRSGFDPLMKELSGLTNLFYAIHRDDVEIVELLCLYGADPTHLGNGVDALNPKTFGKDVPTRSWLREVTQGSASALKMRHILQHYSDPKNRIHAKRPALPDVSNTEAQEGPTD